MPVAVVELRNGAVATEAELIAHCRGRLAAFKRPKRVVAYALNKTATGKIQKNLMREAVRNDQIQGLQGNH